MTLISEIRFKRESFIKLNLGFFGFKNWMFAPLCIIDRSALVPPPAIACEKNHKFQLACNFTRG
jgi:hypothetical protein